MLLTDLETRFGPEVEAAFRSSKPPPLDLTPHLYPAYFHPPQGQTEFVWPVGTAPGPPVNVRINWGVWQTQCPFCESAQHASYTDRWFFCAACQNSIVGNRSVPVIWPSDEAITLIERKLAARPFVSARNWEHWESVEFLAAENLKHGVAA